jgi:hypothetical protein
LLVVSVIDTADWRATPGNAILLNGVHPNPNREIGVPRKDFSVLQLLKAENNGHFMMQY